VKVELVQVQLELELLLITGVVKKAAIQGLFKFSHPDYIKIVNQFERIDRDALEHTIQRLYQRQNEGKV